MTKAKRQSRAEQVAEALEAALVANSPSARGRAYDVLKRKLPPGVPSDLLTQFWAEQMSFAVVYHRLRVTPDEYLDAVLAGLRKWSSPAATFLLTSIADEPTPANLRAANKAFYVLANSPSPYSPKGRATILATLSHAPYLAGAQAVVAAHGWKDDALSFFRALIYDGGDASVDVLRPWVRAAAKADQERQELLGFSRFAQTPNLKALFEELGAT
jgi:hypothetical protein